MTYTTLKTRMLKSLMSISMILVLAVSSISAQNLKPRYFYALGQNSQLFINGITKKTGQLRSLGYTLVPGVGAVAMAMDPSARFLYVANSLTNDVAAFSVNSQNGQLTWAGNVPAGQTPSAITVDATGRFVYVVDSKPRKNSLASIVCPTIAPLSLIPQGVVEFTPA